ncbi:MAG TPA: hypothetical protein VHE35_17330, partial [Kofleriaceae bacterium]|nr:hypothetical protein [Kofleriaceae bacterium]
MERWAPEGPAAGRSRGLRSLAFADHVASPWMSAASTMHPRSTAMFGSYHERSAPGVSWVFPRPWFQDELDWMAAARQSAEASPQFLTTRGTYASARTSPADVAMPVVSPELVVPSMMAGERRSPMAASSSVGLQAGMVTGMAPAAASMQQGLRAWSPSVPFAAAAAAEVVAGAVSVASSTGLASVAERSPLLAGLAMVSPAALSGMAAPRAGQAAAAQASTATIARIDQARRPEPIAPELLAQVQARVSSATPSATGEGRAAETAGEAAAPSSETPSTAAPSAAESTTAAPAAPALSPVEQAVSAAVGASPAMAGALRAIDLLIQASSASPPATAAASTAAPTSVSSAPTGAPSFAAPSAPSFAAPSAPAFAAAMPGASSTFAPVVGPRVAMPAGLGGLAASLETASTISRPLARNVPAMQPGLPSLSAQTAA